MTGTSYLLLLILMATLKDRCYYLYFVRDLKILEALVFMYPGQIKSEGRIQINDSVNELFCFTGIHFGEEQRVEIIITGGREKSPVGHTASMVKLWWAHQLNSSCSSSIYMILNSSPPTQNLPWVAQPRRKGGR